MTREQRMGHLSMLAASVMWGMMAPISKAAMNSDAVSAMLVADVRIFGAAALFWILSFFTKGEKILDKWDYVRLFFAGLFAILLNQGVYVTGVSMTSPVDASIITTTLPIVTMIFAAIFIKEPITGMKAGVSSSVPAAHCCWCSATVSFQALPKRCRRRVRQIWPVTCSASSHNAHTPYIWSSSGT